MRLTDFHAKYFACELTRRYAADSLEKLAPALADAQVDLNPHQVDAALFAFKNPFSKGAILADEVGLGKTIEAGLLLAQKWAERKRRLLVVVPANLRKQWSQELSDKFHLPSVILERGSFDAAIRQGNLNPFKQDAIIICSYQFVRMKEPYIAQAGWDLVVSDEAHRLRNVYKKTSKIALAVKQAIAPFPKVLLTATPLQNSLLELHGLVSIIDDYAFGDVESFKTRFVRLGDGPDFNELRARLAPVCKRTLRKHVLAYIKYTNRHAIVQEFVPSEDEQRLYDHVSAYLQRDRLFALPASQRQLVTLILRKLLASSTFAISATLSGMVERLEAAANASQTVTAAPANLPDNWEQVDELADEWDVDADGDAHEKAPLTTEQLEDLRRELDELRAFHALAKSILKNSKGEALLTALRRGFEAAASAQTQQKDATLRRKAVIFTESRRTQEYLFRLLDETEFRGKVMFFNGQKCRTTEQIQFEFDELQRELEGEITAGQRDAREKLLDNFDEEVIEKVRIQSHESLDRFNGEMEKLDAWAEDRRTALKSEVDDLDQGLRDAKKAARLAANLPEKLARQREARVIEGKRDEAFRAYDQACRDIDRKKDELLDEIGRRLEQTSTSEALFTLRFHVV